MPVDPRIQRIQKIIVDQHEQYKITIPKQYAEALKLYKGQFIQLELQNDTIVISPLTLPLRR